jgi:uncharacterized protein YecE (DUF72 family)
MFGAMDRAASTGHYSKNALASWARRIKAWNRESCDVYVYFDNDQKSAAPQSTHCSSRLCSAKLPKAITRTHRKKKAA